MKCKLNENQYKIYKQFLKEDQESDSQKKAIEMAMSKLKMSKEEATKYIREKLRMEVQYLNGNKKAGKFTLGIFRLYLTNNNTQSKMAMNDALEKICSDEELYKKYDKNLNGLDLQDLTTEINSTYKGQSNKSKLKIGKYKVYKINDYEEAHQFSDYTDWCVTHHRDMYNNYTGNGIYQFYFLIREDAKEVERLPEENCPLDSYGLSMIAVCVGLNGNPKTITCRWNHANGGNDHIMTKDDIIALIGEKKASTVFVEHETLSNYRNILEKIENKVIKGDPKDALYEIDDCSIMQLCDRLGCYQIHFYTLPDELSHVAVKVVGDRFKIIKDGYADSASINNTKYTVFYETEYDSYGELYDLEKECVIKNNVTLNYIHRNCAVLSDSNDYYMLLDIKNGKEIFEDFKIYNVHCTEEDDYIILLNEVNKVYDLYVLDAINLKLLNNGKSLAHTGKDVLRNTKTLGKYTLLNINKTDKFYIDIENNEMIKKEQYRTLIGYRIFTKNSKYLYMIVQENVDDDELKVYNTFESIDKPIFTFKEELNPDVSYNYIHFIDTFELGPNTSEYKDAIINVFRDKIYDENFKLLDENATNVIGYAHGLVHDLHLRKSYDGATDIMMKVVKTLEDYDDYYNSFYYEKSDGLYAITRSKKIYKIE